MLKKAENDVIMEKTMRDMKEYKGGGEMKNLLRIMLAFWNTKIIPSTGRVLATADTRKNFLFSGPYGRDC